MMGGSAAVERACARVLPRFSADRACQRRRLRGRGHVRREICAGRVFLLRSFQLISIVLTPKGPVETRNFFAYSDPKLWIPTICCRQYSNGEAYVPAAGRLTRQHEAVTGEILCIDLGMRWPGVICSRTRFFSGRSSVPITFLRCKSDPVPLSGPLRIQTQGKETNGLL